MRKKFTKKCLVCGKEYTRDLHGKKRMEISKSHKLTDNYAGKNL